MGAFNSAVITEKGQALIAKAVAERVTFEFTRVATSEAILDGDLTGKISIGEVMQTERVASVIRQNGSNVKVSVSFTNQHLEKGYYVRNIGLYANDPQEGEILYSISVADESEATADWMPPFNGVGISSLLVDLITAVSNASSVHVTIDPSLGATVAQIVDLQEKIDGTNRLIDGIRVQISDTDKCIDDIKAYMGYKEDDIYGVEVDFWRKTITRLAEAKGDYDFSTLNPWKRRRCIVSDYGEVLAYYGDPEYTETGTMNDGTHVQVMVEQPIFYTKVEPLVVEEAGCGRGKQILKARYYISATPRHGFKVNECFRDENGMLQDKIYLSAYEGCVYDPNTLSYLTEGTYKYDPYDATDYMMSSIAGAKPVSNIPINSARKFCTNRKNGWKLHNLFAAAITQWLILIEYASFDSGKVVGRGVCSIPTDDSVERPLRTGGTSSLGNESGEYGSDLSADCLPVSYRGEENLWGNISTWLDGINSIWSENTRNGTFAFVKCNGETKNSTTADGYTSLDSNLPYGKGYIYALGYSENFDYLFFPSEISPTQDGLIKQWSIGSNKGRQFYNAAQGGSWEELDGCGAWCLNTKIESSDTERSSRIGARMFYVPQTNFRPSN